MKERKARFTVAVVWMGLSFISVVPFFFMGRSNSGGALEMKMPQTSDMNLHYEQMKSFYRGLSVGEIYPRWEEDTNRGFGAPTMSYYPPGVYYITSAFYATLGDWMRALLGAHLLMMLCSSAAIYVYARQWMTRFAASVVMATYVFLPYRMVDLYVRGAMAELWSFVFMPLMLLFGERLFRRFLIDTPTVNDSDAKRIQSDEPGHFRGWRTMMNISGLAASYGAFIWIHPPTAYQFSLVFGLFLVVLSWRRHDLRGLVYAGAALGLGLAVSAAYLFPAAVEQDLIRHEYVSETWPYHSSYVLMHGPFNVGSYSAVSGLTDSIWIFGAVIILICTGALLSNKSLSERLSPSLREQVILSAVVAGVASFLMTGFSYPVGRLIPRIEIGIFAWRMLSIAGLGVALLTGACVQAANNSERGRQKRFQFSFRSFAAIIVLCGIGFGVAVIVARGFSARPRFVPSAARVNFATIPRSANADLLALPVVERAELAEEHGKVSIDRWDPHDRIIRVELNSPDRLMIRTFDFPGWSAKVDGRPAEISRGRAYRLRLNEDTPSVRVNGQERPVRMNNDSEALVRAVGSNKDNALADGRPVEMLQTEQLGDICLDLPEGAHEIELKFISTATTQIGSLTTASSSSIVLLLVIGASLLRFQSERKKK